MIGGIGRIRDIGDPYNPRRSVGSEPQLAYIPGIPQPVQEGSFVRFGNVSELARQIKALEESTGSYGMSTSPFRRPPIIEAPVGSRLAEEIETARTKPEFNPANAPERGIGPLLRGEEESIRVTDPNSGRSVTVSQDELLFRRGEAPGYDVILADYVSRLKGDVGALPDEKGTRDLSSTRNIDSTGFSSEDPTAIRSKAEIRKDINRFGVVERPYRSESGQIVGTTRINPLDIVDTRVVDPDNTASWKREQEITLGKRAGELLDEYKTPVIAESALNEIAREPIEVNGRLVPRAQLYTPEQAEIAAKRLNIWSDKWGAGTLVGHVYQSEVVRTAGGATNIWVPRPLFDPGIETTRVTPDPKKPLTSTREDTDRLYRIGNPLSRDDDAIRRELAESVGMQTKQRVRREGPKFLSRPAQSTITYNQIENAQKRGYLFERLAEDGSEALMTRPGSGEQVRLIHDEKNQRFYITDAFRDGKRIEVGPTDFLTKEPTAPGIRKAGEKQSGQRFRDVVEELQKGAFMEEPRPADRAAVNQLADAVITGRLAGRGGKKVNINPQEIYQIVGEKGSESRRLFDQIVQERSARYGLTQPREVDLFSEAGINFDDERPANWSDEAEEALRREYQEVLEAEKKGTVGENERTGMQRLAEFGDTKGEGSRGISVKDVGVPDVDPISAPRRTDPNPIALEMARKYTQDPDRAEYLAKLALQRSSGDIDLGTSNINAVMQSLASDVGEAPVRSINDQRAIAQESLNIPQSASINTENVSLANAPAPVGTVQEQAASMLKERLAKLRGLLAR